MLKSNLIKLMEDAVLKAGRGLARDFGEVENLQVSKKGPGDFVTSADHRSEKTLVRELSKVRPKWGFLVEESGEIKGEDKEYRWIADPLDGTNNFMHGIPHFSISLALEKKLPNGSSEIVAGIVHAPALNETFWAEKGVGAYSSNRRLAVSSRDKLEESLLGTYIWHGRGKRTEDDIKIISARIANMRVLGSAALELAYVASGKLEAFWHNNLCPWDMAAGILLVQEARGMVSEIHGGKNMMENGNILATNQALNSKISSILSQYYGNERE